eukprot:3368150-Amphidinium_carterae.1
MCSTKTLHTVHPTSSETNSTRKESRSWAGRCQLPLSIGLKMHVLSWPSMSVQCTAPLLLCTLH